MSDEVFTGTNSGFLAAITISSRALFVARRLVCSIIAGCALPQEVSNTPRSATDQFLLSHL